MQIIAADQNTIFPGPISTALGYFDGVHIGHAAVIGAAVEHARANRLIPAVVTFRGRLGGRQLLMTEALKEEALASLGVDTVIYLDFESVKGLSPAEFVGGMLKERLHAQAAFCGFNYRFASGASADARELERLCAAQGIQTQVIAPLCAGGQPVSSTRIRSLLESGDIGEANALLGRCFAIEATVIRGRRLGTQLGTTTINQTLPEGLVTPRFGVYASAAAVGGESMPAVTNIGVRPTVDGTDVLCETYIPGYAGDLYGRIVRVSLKAFLRGEKRFSGIEELKEQILRDAEMSLRLQSKG
ncbi:MAG: riboflavin biosynthesis protein RibF [Clostridia bacterium]|nr:riboflavin biosynthesis protein RibF [Clostridia bacterium]